MKTWASRSLTSLPYPPTERRSACAEGIFGFLSRRSLLGVGISVDQWGLNAGALLV